MPYVYSISATKAAAIRRSERPIFSGGSHQRIRKAYEKRTAEKYRFSPKYCTSYAILSIEPVKQVFVGLGKPERYLPTFWNNGAKMDATSQTARKCGSESITVYKWIGKQYEQCNRKYFADRRIIHVGSRYRYRNRPELNSLSKRSKNKIRDKIFSLWYQARVKTSNKIREIDANKFNFVTLTFIQKVDDQQAVKLLNTFLTAVRKKNRTFFKWVRLGTFTNKRTGVQYSKIKADTESFLQYIWVAERQANGNIHFHIIFNKRIPVQWANAEWTKVQVDAGLQHSKYKAETKNVFYFLYKSETGGAVGQLFNPYDTRKIMLNDANSPEALAGYLTGYITKNEGKFSCAAWYCSRGISALETSTAIDARRFEEVKNFSINRRVNKKTGKEYTGFIVKNEYCETVTVENKRYYAKHLREMSLYNYWLLQMRRHERKEMFEKVDPYGGQKITKQEFISQYAYIEKTEYKNHFHLYMDADSRDFLREKMQKVKAEMLV